MDALVTDAAPFEIRRPASPGPLIFASPHSGRHYPADFMEVSVLDDHQIRLSEDAFVDDLIDSAANFGATLLLSRYARAYIDVNRAADELDPSMFEDELPISIRGSGARVAAGLGAIARVVADGREIYASKLTLADAMQRIRTVHAPWHEALSKLIAEATVRSGRAVVVDWHSMPSAAARDAKGRPCDFVLGDRFGTSCSPSLTETVATSLSGMGYRVAINAPYAGGYTTERYGKPHEGVDALQVEICRGLYFDESLLQLNAGYERLKRDLRDVFEALNAAWPAARR